MSLSAAETIGKFAFIRCTALTSVDLPKVTTVGQLAFQVCTALTTVNLPAAETIGQSAFSNCTALTTVTFGSVITSIGQDAFINASPTTCTLTLKSGQKQMVWDATNRVYIPDIEAVTAGTNQTWLGSTWKEIIITPSTNE